ncbi:MAG TPA: prolyl oligopeptidase family serine peptidase [Rubricoccaceae bacterium]|nr:prolyl oligopeptidase family serine peptidase [Rubricoccaceae bacterium]
MPSRLPLLCLLSAFPCPLVSAQPIAPGPAPLTVDRIMQDPKTWVGAWPSDVFWVDGRDEVYFLWNPRGRFVADSLFRADPDGGEPVQVTSAERRALPPRFEGWHANRLAYDAGFERRVFARDGDLYVYDLDEDRLARLTATRAAEADPRFSPDGRHVVYRQGDALFALDLAAGATRQLTDLRRGEAPADPAPSPQDAYLRRQQTRLFDVLRERARRDSLGEAARERDEDARGYPPVFYIGDKTVEQLRIDPTERFVTFTLSTTSGETETRLVGYVTESGYAEDIMARAKVGAPGVSPVLHVQDLTRDTTFTVDLTALPGYYDAPDYARERGATADSSRLPIPFGPYWSPDGRFAVLDVRTYDNKDRWIVRLNPETGALTVLDRQRDDAWIAGPGISWWGGESSVGWMADSQRFWFHSERSGFSHLYAADLESGVVGPLTSGAFEVESAVLSKDGETWFLLTSEGSPFERHVWRMDADGGERTRLTSGAGRHDFVLAPDEDRLALLTSTGNRPPDVFVQAARPNADVQRITTSPTEAWAAYPWRAPELIEIPASDGARVPARIYRPANPNGAAVLFVHGAGYLQNVHRWWSTYYREYMFHHLLAERGYLVLDLDYRASSGYGRDWRTAIYRHMGGRDLQDYVDASQYVGAEFGIPPERVAIYGGSYGGFITLMALFTEPEHFGGGAALRSVTDWAHYNHPYTANILNTPTADSLAFARSSPIEFAAGLEDPLLMCHGLVDDNVQPQDIFRLTQRLIELRKEDWELALYPVEPHAFVEPTSWADEYKRVLELIERSVGPLRGGGETEG